MHPELLVYLFLLALVYLFLLAKESSQWPEYVVVTTPTAYDTDNPKYL